MVLNEVTDDVLQPGTKGEKSIGVLAQQCHDSDLEEEQSGKLHKLSSNPIAFDSMKINLDSAMSP